MRRILFVLLCCCSLLLLAGLALAQSGDRIVELEVKITSAADGSQQEWSEVLADVGIDRVRLTSTAGSKPAVSESEFGGQKILKISGVLENNGRLSLPGGNFSLRDIDKIRELVKKLRADGAEVTLAQKLAFGLTAEQLVGLSEMLAAEVGFETKGERIGEVVKNIQNSLSISIVIAPAAQAKLASAELVQEEMKGLSAGTILAAAIRPLGLVLVPSRSVGKEVELSIVDSRVADEHWPVGWPIEQTPVKAAPKLFERKNFELNRAPLSDALNAIEKSVQVPMLYDHNSLARDGIELAKVKVTFNKKKQTYFGAIDDLLGQSRPRLKLELRVDEAQRPFLWISTGQQ